MSKRIDLFNLPYRPNLSIPKEKMEELFSLINNMDTQVLKQFSLIHCISLNIDEPVTGDNLIHKTLFNTNSQKKEFHRLNIIKFLVQNGVNPEKPNRENQTPLHLACRFQYKSIVEYLVSLNIDLNFKDNYGCTAFHYALQGKLELYEEPKEIKPLIKKPKKIDFTKKDNLLKLKKEIWELMKENPFMTLLNNTIENSIFSDDEIKNKVLTFNKKIFEQALKPETNNDIKFIQDNILLIKSSIEEKIKKSWSDFPDLKELSDFDDFKKLDPKSIVKTKANEIKEEIKKLCNIKYEEYNFKTEFDKGYRDFYDGFYKENENKMSCVRNFCRLNDSIDNTNWIKYNKSRMYAQSIDFADNVIDWNVLTFIGGARQITIISDDEQFANLQQILKYDTIEKKVLHILVNSNDIIIPINDINFNFPVTPLEIDKMKLAYLKIFNREFNSNFPIIEKWNDLFKVKNKASVFYTMYCAFSCLNSDDNLTGEINYSVCGLASALNLAGGAIITNENLTTAFKKFYISRAFNSDKNISAKLQGAINILLEDGNLKENFNDYFNQGINNDLFLKIEAIRNEIDDNEKLKKIKELIEEIIKKIKTMKNKPLDVDTLTILTFINNKMDNKDIKYLTLNNIPQFEDNENSIIHIIKKRQTISLLPYINHIFETFFTPDGLDENEVENFSRLKLIEARNLGLYYLGLVPTNEIKEKIKIGDKILTTFDFPIPAPGLQPPAPPPNYHIFNADDELDNHLIPYIGNFLDCDFGDVNIIEKKMNYYKVSPLKYRPPVDFAIKTLKERNYNNLIEVLAEVLFYKNGLIELIDSNKDLSKSFTEIYPVISVIAELLGEDSKKHRERIRKIIENLNKYNGYILIYYYLFSPGKLVKIPKFNYYVIPEVGKTGRFLYYDSPVNQLNQEQERVDDENLITKIPDTTTSLIGNYGSLNNKEAYINYKELVKNMGNDMIAGKYLIKSEDLIFARTRNLPPSIKPVLDELYKYNLMLLIKDIFSKLENPVNQNIKRNIEETINKIKKDIDILDNPNSVYILVGKLIEELMKEQSKIYIQKQTNKILIEVIKNKKITDNKEIQLAIAVPDFEVVFNNTYLKPKDITGDITAENLYQFSKVYNKDLGEFKEFIIYPEEYATTELLKSKYVLKINPKIYEILLTNNINPFILDSNNQSAIFPVLKLHNYEIIKELKEKIDYRDFTEIKPNDFLKDELYNHLSKINYPKINYQADFKNIISNFVSYQKSEIETLIYSNDTFGNNITQNFENSFGIIFYIMLQYLSEAIYKKEKKEYSNYLYINEKANDLKNVYTTDENNFICDLIKNLNIEIKKIEEKSKSLEEGNTKDKYIELENQKKTQIALLLSLIGMAEKFSKKDNLNEKKILKRYEALSNSSGTLVKLLSELIKLPKLEESQDLLPLQKCDPSQIIVPDLFEFYETTNKLSEIYFTFGKYTDNNKVMLFARELLEFMTRHFIIFPYIMLIKKVLLEYFKYKFPNIEMNEINERVTFCFNYETIYNDKISNLEKILKGDLCNKIVLNATNIYKDTDEEIQFNLQSVKEILSEATSLLSINPIIVVLESDASFSNNIREINNYFDTFVNRTILNWQVVIENTLKFNINQGRIIKSMYNLVN